MKQKRKNKAHKSNGRRGRRYRNSHKSSKIDTHKIAKAAKKVKALTKTNRTYGGISTFVSIVPLSSNADCHLIRSFIQEACQGTKLMSAEESESSGILSITLPGKKRKKWNVLPILDTHNPIELARLFFVSELVIFVVADFASNGAFDNQGQKTLKLFKSSGICSFVTVLHSTDLSMKKQLSKELQKQFGNEARVFSLNDEKECLSMLHHLQPDSFSVPNWRQGRPFLLPEAISHHPGDDGSCLLTLQGVVRTASFSVDQIVSIPSIGYFQIHKIEDTVTGITLYPDPTHQQAIVVENIPPEEQNMEVEFEDAVSKEVRVVPKGTSEYQSAWIADMEPSSTAGSTSESDLEEIRDTQSVGTRNDTILTDSDDISWNEEIETEEVEEDKRFPDEVKAPVDEPARSRFQHYRGLKSFRTSPWDAKIDLPLNYSKIFEFEKFNNAMKRAKKEIAEISSKTAIAVGSKVALVLKNVSMEERISIEKRLQELREGKRAPMMVIGLMRDETRMSVQHYRITRDSDYHSSITNKEKFLFLSPMQCFYACPLLSTDNPQYVLFNLPFLNFVSRHDKHKMERTMEGTDHLIASTYGPITFPPMPLLAFKHCSESNTANVAFTGTLQLCAPERVILKHIILTGRPVKAYKKRAVVRGMFHNAEDVSWFKPLELWTKCGQTGYIKESLGTKGNMKCYFDGNIQHHDTVCISLYKRVYPVWPEPFLNS